MSAYSRGLFEGTAFLALEGEAKRQGINNRIHFSKTYDSIFMRLAGIGKAYKRAHRARVDGHGDDRRRPFTNRGRDLRSIIRLAKNSESCTSFTLQAPSPSVP